MDELSNPARERPPRDFSVYGGFTAVRTHVHVTLGIGLLMMAIYGHLYFVPWRRLRRAVAAANWAGVQLGVIRRIVAVNLTLGLITEAIDASGRFCVRRVEALNRYAIVCCEAARA